jgi:hypothetical protein
LTFAFERAAKPGANVKSTPPERYSSPLNRIGHEKSNGSTSRARQVSITGPAGDVSNGAAPSAGPKGQGPAPFLPILSFDKLG